MRRGRVEAFDAFASGGVRAGLMDFCERAGRVPTSARKRPCSS